MLKKERQKVETNPGPEEQEPWAGKRRTPIDSHEPCSCNHNARRGKQVAKTTEQTSRLRCGELLATHCQGPYSPEIREFA